jgi:hypothetical protein
MTERDFQERRKHPRYPASLRVSLVLSEGKEKRLGDGRISGTGRNISGRTGDISFEGLLVKAAPLHADISSFLQHAQGGAQMFLVKLEIEVDDQVILAKGQVRWFKLWYTGQEPYQLEAGLFVRNMDMESRKWWDVYFKKFKP